MTTSPCYPNPSKAPHKPPTPSAPLQITADFVTDVEYNRASQGEWFTGSITDAPMLPVASVAPSYDREGGMSSHRPTPVAIVPGGSLTGLPTIQL